MLEDDQRFRTAQVGNLDALLSSAGGDEELILGHRAKADKRRGRDTVLANPSVALHTDQPVGSGVRALPFFVTRGQFVL